MTTYNPRPLVARQLEFTTGTTKDSARGEFYLPSN